MSTARQNSIPIALLALLLPALVIAQWQVNRQVATPGAAGSVRFASSIQNQSATYMSPSQTRMAVHASGATPSQLRMQAAAEGPMSPSGAIAYIPPPPTYKSTYSGTQGNYVNTQVSATGRAAPSYGSAASSSPMTGSVRYSMSDSAAMSSTPATGSVAYSTPLPSYQSTYNSGSTGSYSSPPPAPAPAPSSHAPSSYVITTASLPSAGSVRYSTPPAATYQPMTAGNSLTPASAFMSAPATGAPMGQSYGSVYYAK